METTLLGHPDFMATSIALLAPLAAFGIVMLFLRARPRTAAGVSIAAMAVSLAMALMLLTRHWGMERPVVLQMVWTATGEMAIPFGYLLDPTSLTMMAVVAAISFLVQVYSLGYMAGDPGFARYYGCMSLFAWAMLTLTVSGSLLQVFVFWELVGLASYLLIGFWFEKFSASEAGKKAFVMTRCGDVAFMLGLALVWLQMGNLDLLTLNSASAVRAGMPPAMITLSALLIFGGIVGKSAQFPLMTWLPDAMEGPTPVSALLHSATMVAAGVYLFARLFGFFSLSPTAMAVCLAVGTISMLLASTMAMVADDIKQVWAYSTISQLGFMLMGLGAGSFFAGVFHLVTHAGFKALLFLTAGVFIHQFDTNDMAAIGARGGRRLISAMICMTVAAAALSGLPPLSGFFSKEVILGHLLTLGNPIWFLAGVLGAFLTAYYTFRLVFMIACPREETADVGHAHLDGGGAGAMAAVLWVLAAVTVGLGFLQPTLHDFLQTATGVSGETAAEHHVWLPVAAFLVALSGVALAWHEFGRRGSPRIGFVERRPALADFFRQRWFLDRLYRIVLDRLVYQGFSRLFTWNDRRVIDGALDHMGLGAVRAGRLGARWHSGAIQHRLMVMFAVVVLLLFYFAFCGA